MSVAEFLSWNPGDGRLWQLVDSEPHAMAPPNALPDQPEALAAGDLVLESIGFQIATASL